MADFQPITEVARIVGVNRLTLRRWVSAGKLKMKLGLSANNRPAVLVDYDAVRKLVGAGIKAGRPKKKK